MKSNLMGWGKKDERIGEEWDGGEEERTERIRGEKRERNEPVEGEAELGAGERPEKLLARLKGAVVPFVLLWPGLASSREVPLARCCGLAWQLRPQ